MCAICRKSPCDSRCPNAEEPRAVHTCRRCEEPIYEGDDYMDTPEGPVCKDCIEGMSVTEFCELIGESFKTAEKEEEEDGRSDRDAAGSTSNGTSCSGSKSGKAVAFPG